MKRTIAAATMVLIAFSGAPMVLAADGSVSVQADDPVVHSVDVPSTMTPGASETISVNVSHGNGLDNVSEVVVTLHRSDVGITAQDSLRDHYNVTYDVSADSLSLSPDPSSVTVEGTKNVQATLQDSLNTSKTYDHLNFTITVEKFAAPSQSTGNSTVNGYNWDVTGSATDLNGDTNVTTNTTEMAKRVGYSVNASSISASGTPGMDDAPFTPNVGLTNDGNVEEDLSFEATAFTASSTSDTIPVGDIGVNTVDDASGETAYTTSSQTLQTDVSYNSTGTIYNWVDIPSGIDSADYTNAFTYGATESAAS